MTEAKELSPEVRAALQRRSANIEIIARRQGVAAQPPTPESDADPIELHYKTVGMTLYRLMQDGLVRRVGQTWFIVPQAAEKVNPGVGAPGSGNLFD